MHLEHRRKQAGRLFAAGKMIPAAIARHLKVSRQSVSRWYREWERGGVRALKGAGRAGRKPRLTDADLRRIERGLKQGPEALGYSTSLWTAQRAAVLITEVCGVRFHPGHVWRLLGQLGWSCQRPAGRALERDEAAIRRWKQQRWPVLKKKPSSKARPSSSSTRAD